MAGLIHFVASDEGASPPGSGAVLVEDTLSARRALWGAGMADLYGDDVPLVVNAGPGPDGLTGFVCADSRSVDGAAVRYLPEAQTWLKRSQDISAYCGFMNDSPPVPADLARERLISGHPCRLADGQVWLCPCARHYRLDDDEKIVWAAALPKKAGMDAAGNWTRDGIAPRFAKLWDDSMRWFDAWVAANGPDGEEDATLEIDFDVAFEAALNAIRTNYRVAQPEAVLLGLLDDAVASDVLCALIDWPTAVELQKKKNGALEV